MKADGVDYETRLELLDSVTYPKPLADTARGRVQHLPPRPSLGRRLRGIAEVSGPRHVRAGADLHRVRRLLRAFPLRGPGAALPGRRLQGAAPDGARRGQDRRADRPDRMAGRDRPPGRLQPDRRVGAAAQPAGLGLGCRREARPATVTSNIRAFRVLVRNALFQRVRLAALGHYAELGDLDASCGWDSDAWADALEDYFEVHDEIGTGPDARGPALLIIDSQAGPVGRPADLRRPRGRPRLGHQRGRRPGRLGRGRARRCSGSPTSASSNAGRGRGRQPGPRPTRSARRRAFSASARAARTRSYR